MPGASRTVQGRMTDFSKAISKDARTEPCRGGLVQMAWSIALNPTVVPAFGESTRLLVQRKNERLACTLLSSNVLRASQLTGVPCDSGNDNSGTPLASSSVEEVGPAEWQMNLEQFHADVAPSGVPRWRRSA